MCRYAAYDCTVHRLAKSARFASDAKARFPPGLMTVQASDAHRVRIQPCSRNPCREAWAKLVRPAPGQPRHLVVSCLFQFPTTQLRKLVHNLPLSMNLARSRFLPETGSVQLSRISGARRIESAAVACELCGPAGILWRYTSVRKSSICAYRAVPTNQCTNMEIRDW